MKKAKRSSFTAFAISLLVLLGCERDMTVQSEVHPDGSIDRTVVIFDADSSNVTNNILDVNREKGWEVAVETVPGTAEGNRKHEANRIITFRKHFGSMHDANSEMDAEVDTLFRIHSDFERKFRWFYTYYEYRDTYRSLSRFPAVSQDDYFTREDYAFINRLPAEGDPISKADSIYLARLNEKIFDLYASRTIYEEMFSDLLMEMKGTPAKWKQTLQDNKEAVYQKLVDAGYDEEEDIMLAVADSLQIPLSPEVKDAYRKRVKDLYRRIEFVSDADVVKFLHVIKPPGSMVATNADSVTHDALYWRPPAIKYLLNDYAMSVTSRTLNVWAVVISSVVVLGTVWLFFRKRVS